MSNLQSFLRSVTPIVPTKPLSKDTTEYFTLGDLWDCYEEWSAYGVGAPIVLKDDVPVIQYYVPHLSAIQIYTIKSPATLRNLSGDHNTDENDLKNLSDESDSKPMESPKGRLGYLYFEYSEVAAISWRIPLVEKVSKLSQNHPGVEKLKSTDLSPASWMAITWCPIYHVPMKNMTNNVPTYFLTYHTISSLYQDNLNDEAGEDASLKKKIGGIPLAPFGLASYKMQNDVWINNAQAYAKFNDLQSAADS